MLADGKIYITDEDGVTTVIRSGPKFELLSENDLQDYTLSSPAVSDGQIFVRTASFIYAIGRRQAAAKCGSRGDRGEMARTILKVMGGGAGRAGARRWGAVPVFRSSLRDGRRRDTLPTLRRFESTAGGADRASSRSPTRSGRGYAFSGGDRTAAPAAAPIAPAQPSVPGPVEKPAPVPAAGPAPYWTDFRGPRRDGNYEYRFLPIGRPPG